MIVRTLVIALAVTLAGCSSTTEPTNYTVTVRNESTVTLTDVRVATGPDDEILASTLAPGQSIDARRTREMHENPAVTAKVNGRAVGAIPIEGFSGFNPALAKGAYAIGLKVGGTTAEPSLLVTVTAVTTLSPP